MACHHHHNHQSPTCGCSHRCNTPPSPPPVDPMLLQSIVSQLLQNPQIVRLYSAAPSAADSSSVDLHPCSSHHPQYQNQKPPKQKQKQKQPHPHRQQSEDQFQDQYSVLASLLQRIDVLESSLHRFSSTTTLSLRQLAARTIQIHFRAHLVRRSRALRELKELASIKSALNLLKSFLSLQKRIDFFALSQEAMDLISQLETIQSGDKMVRDGKSSIRREIGRFLDLVDEICANRNKISLKTVKQITISRNDEKPRVSNAGRESSETYHRKKALKQRNLDNDFKSEDEDSADSDHSKICKRGSSGAHHRNKAPKQHNAGCSEKKLIDNMRERVEKVQQMSKALKDMEEASADSDEGNSNGVIRSKMLAGRKHRVRSHAEKHVCFAEDGNSAQVYGIHENEESEKKPADEGSESESEDEDEDEDENEKGIVLR